MGDAVFDLRLIGRDFVIACEFQAAVADLVERIRTPGVRILRPAARTAAAAPFIGEENDVAGIVERGGVPVGEAGVSDGI